MEIIKNGFKNDILGIELDVYMIEGKEWFKAQDISEYLGYKDTRQMTRNLEITEFNSCLHIMQTVSGNSYEALLINEFVLYEAILKIRNSEIDAVKQERYNKARKFQQWVFSEVLPSIRKNNYYVDKENITDRKECV